MYCYTLSQCIEQDLTWTLAVLSLAIPILILTIWRKEILKKVKRVEK